MPRRIRDSFAGGGMIEISGYPEFLAPSDVPVDQPESSTEDFQLEFCEKCPYRGDREFASNECDAWKSRKLCSVAQATMMIIEVRLSTGLPVTSDMET